MGGAVPPPAPVIVTVTGVSGTQYGQPSIALSVAVDGVSTTQYGTPAAAAIAQPAGVSNTKYGAIVAAYDVSVTVVGVGPLSRGGTPLAWEASTQYVGTIHHVYGAHTTSYGTPSAGHPQLCDVPGVSNTSYGVPSAAVQVRPEPAHTTMAGYPSAAVIVSVAGVCGTKYGTPRSVFAHVVKGVCNTKYGRPRVAFPGGYMVYGLNNGRRAGVPRAAEIT